MAKYADLPASYLFQPVALETLGPIKDSAVDFLSALGGRIGTAWGEIRERQFLFQRLSVTIQRFNSIFCTTVSLNVMIRTSSLSRLLILAFFLLTLGIFTTKGTIIMIIILNRETA